MEKTTSAKAKKPAVVKAIGDHTQIKIGDRIRDRITGRIGTAREQHWHINGCNYIHMERDGATTDDTDYFPIQRFELIESRPQFNPSIESMEGSHIKLGNKCRDLLTGFVGHAIIWAIPMFGTHRIALEPGLDKEGKLKDSMFFDETRLEVISPDKPPVAKALKPKRKSEGCAHHQTVRRDVAPR